MTAHTNGTATTTLDGTLSSALRTGTAVRYGNARGHVIQLILDGTQADVTWDDGGGRYLVPVAALTVEPEQPDAAPTLPQEPTERSGRRKGARRDPDASTGRPARKPRELSPDEQRARDAVTHLREEHARVLEELSPGLAVEADPPVRREVLKISAPGEVSESAELVRIPRLTPSGLTSALVLSARSYVADSRVDYALVYVSTFAANARAVRTHGVTIRPSEAREVAAALVAWVDALEAKDGAP
jgi:hypothetical protein